MPKQNASEAGTDMNKPPVESEDITSGEKEFEAASSGITLEEYQALKKQSNIKKESKEAEGIKESHTAIKNENANLLGFQGGDDQIQSTHVKKAGILFSGEGKQQQQKERSGQQNFQVNEETFPPL